jgi:hypothetical protein
MRLRTGDAGSNKLPALYALSLKSQSLVLGLVLLFGCSQPVPAAHGPISPRDSYGYEGEDDPGGHDASETGECDPNTCIQPMVCVRLVTDTTLAVPDRKVRARCVSRESDLCRLDTAACATPSARP